jgi:Ca-activated chloride channel family protein
MHFVHPAFLFVSAGAFVALGVIFAVTNHARGRALARIGAERLLPELTASLSPGRRYFKQAALAVGTSLVLIAFARPELGYRWEEVQRRGVDLLFALDVSKSMLTRDVKPNRLERAKLAVRSLAEKFPDNRVGLVVFAGDAFVETPLTLDHGIFDESVAALDANVIPVPGTNLGSAIDRATHALAGDTHDKILVLLTDGEELSGDALDAARRAAKEGVVIDTIGVGTPRGELVPEAAENGQTAFVRDESGKLVTSRLDETRLAGIARATGGEYRPLGDTGEGLESLYRDRLAKLPGSELASRTVRVPIERFQWPLGVGLLLLGIEPLIGERRRRRARQASPRRSAAAVGVVTALVLLPSAAWASPQNAERAYAKGDFKTAEREYTDAARSTPSDARLSFNTGAAAYRTGAYDEASKAFESTLRSTDLGLQEQAYYNLGNVSFRLGEAALAKQDIEGTKMRFKQAIDEYERALHLRGDDADARYNLDFVKRKLAELEQRAPQQQQNQSGAKQAQPNQQGQQQQKQQDQGQPQKQQGPGQQQQKQQGQGQQQKQQDQGQRQQKQQGQGQQQKQEQGPQPDQQGQAKPQDGQGQAQPNQPAPPKQTGDTQQNAAGERSRPGALSKADAEALLDSLRGELEVDAPSPKNTKHAPAPHETERDW